MTEAQKRITQQDWVTQHIIKTNGTITRNTCLVNYISRLGAIIPKIEETTGALFDGEYVPVVTPFGNAKDYKYTIRNVNDISKLKEYMTSKFGASNGSN